MKKPQRCYVVRVVQTRSVSGVENHEGGIIDDGFLECLRYAGHVTVHEIDHKLNMTSRCFDIRCPAENGYDMQAWAEMNAKRMRSFGFNAVAAPSTLPLPTAEEIATNNSMLPLV